jgi:Domain of unknown function (DUF5666)
MDHIKKYKIHIIWFLAVVVAFAGGMYVSSMNSSAANPNAAGGVAAAGRRGGFAGRVGTGTGAGGFGAGGGFAMGQILSKDSDSFTVQLPTGNSEIVFYSSSTQIIKPTAVSADALTTGTNVMIGGSTNSDGSVTAQTIQIRNATSTVAGTR